MQSAGIQEGDEVMQDFALRRCAIHLDAIVLIDVVVVDLKSLYNILEGLIFAVEEFPYMFPDLHRKQRQIVEVRLVNGLRTPSSSMTIQARM